MLGRNNFRIFRTVYTDLVNSVKFCVMTVADHCYSIGLIGEETYDQIVQLNLTDKQKARILLGKVHASSSCRPSALKEFVTILSKLDYCKQVAHKIQQLLQ